MEDRRDKCHEAAGDQILTISISFESLSGFKWSFPPADPRFHINSHHSLSVSPHGLSEQLFQWTSQGEVAHKGVKSGAGK